MNEKMCGICQRVGASVLSVLCNCEELVDTLYELHVQMFGVLYTHYYQEGGWV